MAFESLLSGLAGGLIGWAMTGFTNPAGFMYGYAIGSMVGSLLFPPDIPTTTIEGPRLDDLKVQRSEYGGAIPVVYGKVRTAGNVIWSTDLVERRVIETTESVQHINYYYSVSCAVALCAGEIDAVERIYANSELIYNSETGERKNGLNFRVYKGTETQQPDAAITSDVTAADSVPYRGVAYVVFENLDLLDFGNRLPMFEFVVSKGYDYSYSANSDLSTATLTSSSSFIDQETGYLWAINGDYNIEVIDPENETTLRTIDVRDYDQFTDGGGLQGTYLLGIEKDTLSGLVRVVFYPAYNNSDGTVEMTIDPTTYECISSQDKVDHPGTNAYEHGGLWDHVVDKSYYFGGHTTLGYVRDITGGIHTQIITLSQDVFALLPCARWLKDSGDYSVDKTWSTFQRALEQQGVNYINGPVFYDDRAFFAVCSEAGVYLYQYVKTEEMNIVTAKLDVEMELITDSHVSLLDDTTAGWGNGTGNCSPNVTYDHRRNVIYATEAIYNHTFIWYADLNTTDPTWEQITGFAHNCHYVSYDEITDRLYISADDDLYAYSGDPDSLQQVYSRTDTGATLDGLMFSTFSTGYVIDKGAAKVFVEKSSGNNGPLLTTVLSDICDKAGIDSGDLDMTGLSGEGYRVKGYAVARNTSARSAIEPLRKMFRFDVVESDWALKFLARSGTSADSISENYLGSADAEKITITRQQETELPLEVAVSYMDMDRDFLASTQRSRKTTGKADSSNIVNVDLPVVMDADEAVQLADILLHQAWISRTQFSFVTNRRDLDIDPGDVVTVAANSESYDVLVNGITANPDGKLEISGVRDIDTAYSSDSTADSGDYTEQTVNVAYPTAMQHIDLPRWYSDKYASDQYGPAFVACPVKVANWKGATVYYGTDNVAFSAAAAFTSSQYSTIGTADTASLGDFTRNILDTTNTFDVTVAAGQTLSSITWAEMLEYGNLCHIGDEVLQFQTVTDNGDGTYTCSNLLRGRFGSEWAVAGHAGIEAFAILNRAKVADFFTTIDETDYSVDLYTKAVTTGLPSANVSARQITHAWNNLKPYAPAHVEIAASGSDYVITWVRRDRKDHEWSDGADIDMSEASEEYEVDIHDASDDSVARTYSSLSSETATYTAADQATDGLANWYAKVYQISAAVDRGFGAQSETI